MTLAYLDYDKVTITRTDFSEAIKSVGIISGVDMPVWKVFSDYYDICHESIITPLSMTILKLYYRLGGTRNETYESYMRLPPKYVVGCEVIENELRRIESYKNG